MSVIDSGREKYVEGDGESDGPEVLGFPLRDYVGNKTLHQVSGVKDNNYN